MKRIERKGGKPSEYLRNLLTGDISLLTANKIGIFVTNAHLILA